MPTTGITALQAIRKAGRVQPGQHVAIIGASGGVGTFAVQIAKADGAEVTGAAGPANVDMVRSLGADISSTSRPTTALATPVATT